MTMTFVDALASAICRQMTIEHGREPVVASARGGVPRRQVGQQRPVGQQQSQASVRLGRREVARVASAITAQLAAADQRHELPLVAIEI